ncbi:MAG: hypothetical protein IKK29_06845 [Christensenellaceae bacterium]|nr:hypothetical protein [Christensenellaceae bacterium]
MSPTAQTFFEKKVSESKKLLMSSCFAAAFFVLCGEREIFLETYGVRARALPPAALPAAGRARGFAAPQILFSRQKKQTIGPRSKYLQQKKRCNAPLCEKII